MRTKAAVARALGRDLQSGDFFFDQPKKPRSPESTVPDFESDRDGGRCFHMGQTQPDMLTTERSKREKEEGEESEGRGQRRQEGLEDTFRGSAEKGTRAVRWRQTIIRRELRAGGLKLKEWRPVEAGQWAGGCDCDRARWRRWATRDRARALAHSKETGEKE